MTLEARLKKIEGAVKPKDEKKVYVLNVIKDGNFKDDQSIGYKGNEHYQRLQEDFKKYPKLEKLLRETYEETQAEIKGDEKVGMVVGFLSLKESELVDG